MLFHGQSELASITQTAAWVTLVINLSAATSTLCQAYSHIPSFRSWLPVSQYQIILLG